MSETFDDDAGPEEDQWYRDEIPDNQRVREGVPQAGRWFWNQAAAMEALKQEGGGILLSWPKKKYAFAYGFYSGAIPYDIMQRIIALPEADRYAHEIIVEDVPCKGYADLEWIGPPDTSHEIVSCIAELVRVRAKEQYGVDAEIHISDCSRQEDEGYKNSHHMSIENLIFKNNHDGTMKSFFTFEQFAGKIDMKVYSRNRAMRLPLCRKRGKIHPLIPMTGTPLANAFVQPEDDIEACINACIPFFVSNPRTDHDNCKVVECSQQAKLKTTSSKVAQSDGAKRARTEEQVEPENLLQFPKELIEQALRMAGDRVSYPTNVKWLADGDEWKVQCDQREPRICIANPVCTHKSNRCLIFVAPELNRFRLKYHCCSPRCSGPRGDKILGHIQLIRLRWTYLMKQPVLAISDAPQGPAQPMQVEPGPEPDSSGNPPDNVDMPDQVMDEQEMQLTDLDDSGKHEYLTMKNRFELTCFKICEPFSYGRIGKKNKLSILSHVALKQYYCDLKFWTIQDGKNVPHSFIERWLHDPNKRCVQGIVVDPTGKSDDYYNLWAGFLAESLPPVPEDQEDELIAPILRHLNDVITHGNAVHTGWLLDYLANIVKRPEKKTQVAISLYGVQGCGKGIIFEFFRTKVLGASCSYQTSKPENDLLGRFANGFLNRVMVQIDEVKSLHDFADRIKDMITNPTINYERKGHDTIEVANLTNMILTSNNANALTVTADDRRYALFHCSPRYKSDPDYFTSLGAQLDRPEVARAFYQHLLKRDLSPYPNSFQFTRPITDYYREAQRSSIPVLSRFLSAFVNQGVAEALQARQLYQRYEAFRDAGNYKFTITASTFAKELKKVQGIERKHAKTGTVYELTPELIKKHLEDLNEHDPDAEF
jgi:hypothetical protein